MSETQQQSTETTKTTETKQAPNAELEAMKAELAKAKQELEGFKSKEVSLRDKVLKESETKDKEKQDAKELENALTFSLTAKDFVKANESILPKEVAAILQASEKESYGSAMHKANAIKEEFIQAFFSQQSNLDLLTPSQKTDLAEFQKLTKNWREAKAPEVYKNLFEPALESLKRVKKAEELYRTKQGYSSNTDSEQAYKSKLAAMAEKKFFGGKNK